MIEKIPIDDTREGNCCPVCGSTRITNVCESVYGKAFLHEEWTDEAFVKA